MMAVARPDQGVNSKYIGWESILSIEGNGGQSLTPEISDKSGHYATKRARGNQGHRRQVTNTRTHLKTYTPDV
jgi:hypothetical protein